MSKELDIIIALVYGIYALICTPTIICYIIVTIANRIQNTKMYTFLVTITVIFWISLAMIPLAIMLYYCK